jgi:serine protease Do/serine protease DegQ
MQSGDEIDITYVRGDRTHSTRATLGEKTEVLLGANIHRGLTGSVFADVTSPRNGGVELKEVLEGSRAAQRDLRSGDTITHVNRTRIHNLKEFREIAERSSILFLFVKRGERDIMIQIR